MALTETKDRSFHYFMQCFINQPASFKYLVLVHASQPTWFATVTKWLLLLPFPLHHPSSSSHERAYNRHLTFASPKHEIISQDNHSLPGALPIARTIVNSEPNHASQCLIHDVQVIASPSLEISHLSRRKHLARPVPVDRNPIPDPGCADESLPIKFPVDGARYRRA